MQTWTFLDRSRWGTGPWESESDKAQWTDAATNLPCLAVRNGMGAWCGYVGVSEGHPFFAVPYNECPEQCGEAWCGHTPESVLSVHGGISYSDYCREDQQPHGICHIPEPGQSDHVYWFGFDTCRYDDLSPLSAWVGGAVHTIGIGEYRTLTYVQSECAKLAAQLREVGDVVHVGQ